MSRSSPTSVSGSRGSKTWHSSARPAMAIINSTILGFTFSSSSYSMNPRMPYGRCRCAISPMMLSVCACECVAGWARRGPRRNRTRTGSPLGHQAQRAFAVDLIPVGLAVAEAHRFSGWRSLGSIVMAMLVPIVPLMMLVLVLGAVLFLSSWS